MIEPARVEDRSKCPLERAGWNLAGIPIADYVTGFARGWDSDGPDWLVEERSLGMAAAAPTAPQPPQGTVAA